MQTCFNRLKDNRMHFILEYIQSSTKTFCVFFLELEEVLTVDGNYKFMFAINNQFPAPTLVFHDQQVVKFFNNSVPLLIFNLKIKKLT